MAAVDEPFDAPTEAGAIIPFGRMKPSPVVVETWSRELAALNAKRHTAYRFPSPIDAVSDMERKRAMPTLPLPAAWGDFAKRARLYAGETMAVAGPTGGGKTSFAIEIGCAAVGDGVPVLWLPKELDPPEVNLRIVANRSRTHMQRIREEWSTEAITRTLTAVSDRWHYIDEFRDTQKQLRAIEAGIALATSIYRKPPLVVVDYVGKFASGARDRRAELADVIEELRSIGVRMSCFMLLLSQTSRGNDQKLTGKVDLDSAADAIGVSAETSELEHAASVGVALNVFKADDAQVLDAHVLVTKARGTGREGRVGFAFVKAGGQWKELDFIPATPGEVAQEVVKAKKDKTRVLPVEPQEIRKQLNTEKSDAAIVAKQGRVIAILRAAGPKGVGGRDLRTQSKLGRDGTAILEGMVARGEIEERKHGKWFLPNQEGDEE